jgi:hypothetical protein
MNASMKMIHACCRNAFETREIIFHQATEFDHDWTPYQCVKLRTPFVSVIEKTQIILLKCGISADIKRVSSQRIKIMDQLDAEIKALSTISDTPNLVALSYALRHPETWPKDFVWDYGDCSHCAVGLATRLWNKYPEYDDNNTTLRINKTWIAREMSMPYREAEKIFFELAPTKTITKGFFRTKKVINDYDAITPDHVADAIDRYLENAIDRYFESR